VPLDDAVGFSLHRLGGLRVPPQARSTALAIRQDNPTRFDLFWSRATLLLPTIGATATACAVINPACGVAIGAVTSVILAGMIVWEQFAYHQRGGTVRMLGGVNSVYDPAQDIFSIDGPDSLVTSVQDGVSTKLTRSTHHVGRSLFARDDLNETHIYYEAENTDESTGQVTHSFLDLEPDTGHAVVSSRGAAGLQKRQNGDDHVAHYSFDQMQEHAREHLPMSQGEAEQLTEVLWAVKHDNDIGNPCLAFGAGSGAFQRGYFQLSTGPFRDQLSTCPSP